MFFLFIQYVERLVDHFSSCGTSVYYKPGISGNSPMLFDNVENRVYLFTSVRILGDKGGLGVKKGENHLLLPYPNQKPCALV